MDCSYGHLPGSESGFGSWGHLRSGTSGAVALSGPQVFQGRAKVQDSWLCGKQKQDLGPDSFGFASLGTMTQGKNPAEGNGVPCSHRPRGSYPVKLSNYVIGGGEDATGGKFPLRVYFSFL